MREFGVRFEQAVQRGLAPEKAAEQSPMFAEDMANLRPTEFGAEGVLDLPTTQLLVRERDWPFPQVFIGQSLYIIATRDKLYTKPVDDVDSGVRNVRTIDVVDAQTGVRKSIPSGDVWQFVDMGEAFLLSNGECLLYAEEQSFTRASNPVAYLSEIQVNTIQRFKGRVLFGGLGKGVLERITNGLSEIQDEIQPNWSESPLASAGLDSNYVLWSSIGGGDLTSWLLNPTLLEKQGGFDQLRTRMKRNQMGWIKLPVPGMVQALMPVSSNQLLAFAPEGVTVLRHNPGGGDVPATFGTIRLTSVGVLSRKSVTATRGGCFYVGTDNELRVVSGELELTKIGYGNHLRGMEDVLLQYDEHEEELYCSDAGRSLVLTRSNGAYWREVSVTSLFSYRQQTNAALAYGNDSSAYLETNKFDLGQQGDKTLTQIDLSYESAYQAQAQVLYRNNRQYPFQRLPYKTLGPDGSLRVRVQAKQFKVRIFVPSYEGLMIDDLKVRFQLPDNRRIRGTRANPVNETAG